MTQTYFGGCQCGAVRFRVDGEPGRASICHCRMCQKATGGPFGAFVDLGDAALTWTRGEPSRFVSSNRASRGFCARCGTPLFYEAGAGPELSICAFDNPAVIAPTVQLALNTKIGWLDKIEHLPRAASNTAQGTKEPTVSYQHPDHDTVQWPERIS